MKYFRRLRPARPCGNLRTGMTLVEVLIAISLSSIVLGAVALLLHAGWKAEQGTRNRGAITATLGELASRFRADAHAAQDATDANPSDGQSIMNLTFTLLDERTIVYEAEEARITRVERRGDELLHRETFRLSAGTTAQFELGTKNGQAAVSLLISRPMASDSVAPASRRTTRIDAFVGLQNQWAHSAMARAD